MTVPCLLRQRHAIVPSRPHLLVIPFGLTGSLVTACGGGDDPFAEGFDESSANADASSAPAPGFGDATPLDASDTSAGGACKKMDIVSVVDDSGSMKEEQDNLGVNFPKFASVIDKYKTTSGDLLDYRLAVTSSKVSKTQGAFAAPRGAGAPKQCVAGPARPWLERTDGDVATMFPCRAQVGTAGGNPEQLLESAFLGLSTRITDGTNTSAGTSFVREDALLAIIAITDEDEGGTEDDVARDMALYPGLFDGIKGGRDRWAAAVIAGETKCSSKGLGEAAEATRLKQFVAGVGKNGVFASICTGDLTDGLTKALETFDIACKSFPNGPR